MERAAAALAYERAALLRDQLAQLQQLQAQQGIEGSQGDLDLVAASIAGGQGLKFEAVPYCPASGVTLLSALQPWADEDVTALVIQQPNFFGGYEDVAALTDWEWLLWSLVTTVIGLAAFFLFRNKR
jgi:hypothetical protein